MASQVNKPVSFMPQHISLLKFRTRIKQFNAALRREQMGLPFLLLIKAITFESDKELSEEGLSASLLGGANYLRLLKSEPLTVQF